MALLDVFARYDDGAVVTVRPFVLDSGGETLRWIVEIDGEDTSDVDARVESSPERPGVMVMALVRRDEELEIESWSTERYPHGPAAVIRTLGDLRRRSGT
jgi:hypothetical protein